MGTMHFLRIFISLSPPLSRLKARHCIGVASENRSSCSSLIYLYSIPISVRFTNSYTFVISIHLHLLLRIQSQSFLYTSLINFFKTTAPFPKQTPSHPFPLPFLLNLSIPIPIPIPTSLHSLNPNPSIQQKKPHTTLF